MIFRLKTSKQTQEIFEELERRTNFKPYTLVKHAIAWSVAEKTSVKDFKSDSNGLDLDRPLQVIMKSTLKPCLSLLREDFLVKMNSFLNM